MTDYGPSGARRLHVASLEGLPDLLQLLRLGECWPLHADSPAAICGAAQGMWRGMRSQYGRGRSASPRSCLGTASAPWPQRVQEAHPALSRRLRHFPQRRVLSDSPAGLHGALRGMLEAGWPEDGTSRSPHTSAGTAWPIARRPSSAERTPGDESMPPPVPPVPALRLTGGRGRSHAQASRRHPKPSGRSEHPRQSSFQRT